MNVHYIDLSQATNGSGTKINPYNSFTELNALAGDQSGAAWLIKASGLSVGSGIKLFSGAAIANLHISSYGTGQRPIIDCRSTVTGNWTDAGNNSWYTTEISNAASTNHGIFVDGVKITNRSSIVLMENNGFASYYDSVNNRHYVNLGGLNPNNLLMQYTDLKHGIEIHGADASSFSGLHIIGSDGTGAEFLAMKDNCSASDMKIEDAGGWGTESGPGNGLTFYGPSDNGDPALNAHIGSIESYRGNNNIVETRNLDGASIERCYGEDHSMGYELWGYVKNSSYRFNQAKNIGQQQLSTIGHGNLFWLTHDTQAAGVTGFNTGNTFAYNIGRDIVSHVDVESTSDNNKFYNNVFHGQASLMRQDETQLNGWLAFSIGSSAGLPEGLEIKNNIFILEGGNPTLARYIGEKSSSTGSYTTPPLINGNIYHNLKPGATAAWKYEGVTQSSLVDWKTASGDTSSLETDPLLANIDKGDYTPTETSPARGLGADVGETMDFNKLPVINNDSGAFEFPPFPDHRPVGSCLC